MYFFQSLPSVEAGNSVLITSVKRFTALLFSQEASADSYRQGEKSDCAKQWKMEINSIYWFVHKRQQCIAPLSSRGKKLHLFFLTCL